MRNALAETLYDLAREDERIVVLVADISPAGAMDRLRAELPDRFINVGIAEQAMIGVAAGLAMRGMRPFCYTIATFALFRAYEFIRCDLAYQDLPVTVVGMGAGLAYPTLGGTHQAVEDVAIAMACPGLTVLAPCDPAETIECTRWCGARESGGPVYMRIGKAGEPTLTGDAPAWAPGRLRWMRRVYHRSTPPTCVLSYGPIAIEARRVAELLGADLALVGTLAPQCCGDDELTHLGSYYGRLIVVEEASGAPLYAQIIDRLMRARGRTFGTLDVRSFALPRTFPHICGMRAEVLAHFGLTTGRIIENLGHADILSGADG